MSPAQGRFDPAADPDCEPRAAPYKRAGSVVILMYHALWRDTRELEAIDPDDRPYALQVPEFERQLDGLLDRGIEVLDPAALHAGARVRPGVVLSFDDGHASNALYALALLRERGMRAAFFITSGFVDARAGYCSAEQVRELDAAGMTVGGHGHTHRFLSELPDAELNDELGRSRDSLQVWLGRAPTQMSFPGGRFDARVLRVAARQGFEVLHGSRPGCLRGSVPAGVLPRIAIRPGMDPQAFADVARGAAWPMLRARGVHAAKAAVRGVLGNDGYHRLYHRIKG